MIEVIQSTSGRRWRPTESRMQMRLTCDFEHVPQLADTKIH